jgi:hypothetical protein
VRKAAPAEKPVAILSLGFELDISCYTSSRI